MKPGERREGRERGRELVVHPCIRTVEQDLAGEAVSHAGSPPHPSLTFLSYSLLFSLLLLSLLLPVLLQPNAWTGACSTRRSARSVMLSPYAHTLQCSVLTSRMLLRYLPPPVLNTAMSLRARYAMSGTDLRKPLLAGRCTHPGRRLRGWSASIFPNPRPWTLDPRP
eukprot:3322886-Rhodomonas_salina.2